MADAIEQHPSFWRVRHRIIAPSEHCAHMSLWVVCQTKPRIEKYAADLLADNGYVPYLPMARVTTRHAGQVETKLEPLFARYLFVEQSRRDNQLTRLRGKVITSLVMSGDHPATASQAVIDGIRSRETNGAVEIDNSPRGFVHNQPVRIANGAMQGAEAIYIQRSGKARAVVLLSLCGAKRAVQISLDDIRAA